MAKAAYKNIKIIWHMGFQKTGTTSFQSILRRNYDQLSEEIAVFPKRKWTRAVQEAGLAFWADPNAKTKKALEQAAQDIRAVIRDAERTCGVVSDENIIGLELYDDKGGMIDMAAAILPILEKACAPATCEFVFYTRDFDGWFKSAYNQVVKQLRCRADFDTWVANAPFSTDWQDHHERLSSVVESDVHFRDMKQDAADDLPIGGYILQLAGFDDETLRNLNKPVGRNESLSPGALGFMLELNRSHMHDNGLDIVRRKMLKNPDAFT
ncbi:hypothetical protein [Amylibacter sp. IMCC11727]|uniref:hypothetical protein n=1 Tax=Amylibacter sp. IMCC11727 TaxID=3039851 RepID=UPI00244DD825|nr:hypothetical protein [Amylibacter sp. IMCC11727]WGI23141.1 hypothetical protein QBD29_06895 [Amylibacter sp. IMCC11727]